LLGTQLSQKRGFPYGWYPIYGHASDFSWVAGTIQLRTSMGLDGLKAGCAILCYDERGLDSKNCVQLSEANQHQDSLPWGRDGGGFVFFGHPVRSGEQFWACLLYTAPGYIVDRWQPNPAH
jgi:hypothetical protein